MVLHFDNPDRMSGLYLPKLYDHCTSYPGGSGTPDVRPDGESSRPAFTATGGDALLGHHVGKPGEPGVNGGGASFVSQGRFLWEAWPADPVAILGPLAFQGSGQNSAVINPDGTMSIYRGIPGAGTEIKAGVTALSLDTVYRIGYFTKVKKIGGFAEIWIDTGSGQSRFLTYPVTETSDTEYQEGFFWDGGLLGLVDDCAVNHWLFGDDYGHLLGTGPELDLEVLTQYAARTGSQFGWTPNTGSIPTAVDDPTPDGDATRVSAQNNGERFTVGMSTPGRTTEVLALQDTVLVKNMGPDSPFGYRWLNVDSAGLRSFPTVIGVPSDGEYHGARHLYYQRVDNGQAMSTDYATEREAGLELVVN